jgi:hypothetical protein
VPRRSLVPKTNPYFAKPLPKSVYWIAGIGCALFTMGENPVMGIATILAAVVIARMVWRVGEAQVPLYVCAYQWIQVMASVLQAELYGAPLANIYGGLHFETSMWLSLLTVTLFAVAMGWIIQKMIPQTAESIDALPLIYERLKQWPLFATWLGIFLINGVVAVAIKIPSLGTVWNPIGYLRFGMALLLFLSIFAKREGWLLLIIIVAAETAVGFLSYFSSFKMVYFILLLSAAAFLHYRKSMWWPFTVACVVMFGLGLIWQTIKADYRSFMSGGEREQTVSVEQSEQLDYLQNAIGQMDSQSLIAGAENTLRRLEYIYFFGLAVKQVPQNIDHTNGRLWKEALENVFMPRIFFPDKMAYNDSDRTNEFCGIRVADATEGTSIGIGYAGESYIDFGPFGMFVPVMLFGLLVGWCYASLLKNAAHPLLGMGMGTALVFASPLFLESSNAKMMGSLVSAYLVLRVLLAVQKHFLPEIASIYIADDAEHAKTSSTSHRRPSFR